MPIGSASISADTNSYCLAARNGPRWTASTVSFRPPPTNYKTSLRYKVPAHRRDRSLQRHRQRSNPHSSYPRLILSSTFPRFPPLGLVRRLPSHLAGYGKLRSRGQASDNP
jgi:hypothetical protein